MVQELTRSQVSTPDSTTFPASAPAAYPVFYRTYSRKNDGVRESWPEVVDRTVAGLVKLGNLTPEEGELIRRNQSQLHALTSGRWLWIGGTAWSENPKNFSGAYNCTSTNADDWRAFGLMMDLAMMGCGTGAVLEPCYIDKLPAIRNPIDLTVEPDLGVTPVDQRREETQVTIDAHHVTIKVGDSRQGWVASYQTLLELSSDDRFTGPIHVTVNLHDVRPAGEALKGFGGVANPVKLPEMYQKCVGLLNKAVGRQLNSVECCLLIDEAAVTIVAGNIRRSAGIRQFSDADALGGSAKDNLWQQDDNGNWRIDPERDALRMANHTRVYHHKPSIEEMTAAVRKQFYSGEGAIQYAPEAIARSNADLLSEPILKQEFLEVYTSLGREEAKGWLRQRYPAMPEDELEHRFQRYGLNPCGK
ncbi:MAG: ribonucleoside-triphosphate reductase, adenosylcobalamin-dependent [Prochlorothrix sp.]|nr:ribonucleoside-triphosphate reductase, adenosylcobalamin-dependent [Prochlorothrix sp.]